MAKTTGIQWADSTLNLMAGCNGCELWTTKVRKCYAGKLITQYAGKKGWPVAFNRPTTFPERIKELTRWSDLTGKERPDKPWLNGYPRIVFLNDLGDTFTEDLSEDWLLPIIPILEDCGHIIIILTKRVRRMVGLFSRLGRVPSNFWLMTTVTGKATEARISELVRIKQFAPDATLGLSLEPLWDKINLDQWWWRDLSWVVLGGESGQNATPFELEIALDLVAECRKMNVPVFVKQIGDNPTLGGKPYRRTSDKGGNWDIWPAELKIREMPRR